MNNPKWTVFINIDNGYYVGTKWEFFDSEELAKLSYNEYNKYPGRCATMRPFHENDRIHMGTIHRK